MQRREFLNIAVKAWAASTLWPILSSCVFSEKDFLLLAGEPPQGPILGRINLLTNTLDIINLPKGMKPHGFAQNPWKKEEVVVTSKEGTLSCVYSVKDHKVLHAFPSATGKKFYGHSVFLENDGLFVTVESSQDSYNSHGSLVLRDHQSNYKVIEEIPSFGWAPHDAVAFGGPNEIIVGNNASDASETVDNFSAKLTHINLKTGKEIQSWNAKKNNQVFGHFSKSKAGVFISAQRFQIDNWPKFRKFLKEGNIKAAGKISSTKLWSESFLLSPNGTLDSFTFPSPEEGWQVSGFSSATTRNGAYSGVTFGPSHSVGVFATAEKKLIKRVQFPTETNSISPNLGSGFYVGTADKDLWTIDPPSFEPAKVITSINSDHSILVST